MGHGGLHVPLEMNMSTLLKVSSGVNMAANTCCLLLFFYGAQQFEQMIHFKYTKLHMSSF